MKIEIKYPTGSRVLARFHYRDINPALSLDRPVFVQGHQYLPARPSVAYCVADSMDSDVFSWVQEENILGVFQ